MRTQHGFSLIELLTVLLIISAMTKIALEYTKDFAFQGRYEVTKDRYEKIKQAIIGRPDVIINGQPDIAGFVADMGRLPRNLQELLVRDYCKYDYRISGNTPITDLGKPVSQELINDGAGTAGNTQQEWCEDDLYSLEPAQRWIAQGDTWKGPYLTSVSPDYEPDALSDGWGNEANEYCSDSAYTTKATCQGASKTWKYDDHNYGWYVLFEDADGNSVNVWTNFDSAITLKLKSKGKDQCLDTELCRGFNTYDLDYPVNQPAIARQDWMVDINDLQFVVNTNLGECDSNLTLKSVCEIIYGVWDGTKCTIDNLYSCRSQHYFWAATSGPGTETCWENALAVSPYYEDIKTELNKAELCGIARGNWNDPDCEDIPKNVCINNANQAVWMPTEQDLSLVIVRNNKQYQSITNSIIKDGRNYAISFGTGQYLPQGQAMGFVLKTGANLPIDFSSMYPSSYAGSICINPSETDCNNNGGYYFEAKDQAGNKKKFCDEIKDTDCNDISGAYHPKVTFNLTPNSTLPVINW